MDKFIITGGKPLTGSLEVEGSKNAALPIIFATLLIKKGVTTIKNVPPLRDIFTAIKVLEFLGAKVEYDQTKQIIKVDATFIHQNTAPYELMRQMRASFLVLGPILVRMGEAQVSLPGGCVLGSRPVDYIIEGFKNLGAEVEETKGYVIAKAKKLAGGTIFFDRPSHTGTENILYAAVLAKGKTEIFNAACDPEVVDVANFLNKAGAKINGAGTPHIVVEPVKELKAVDYSVCGDRLVAGTFMMSAAITGGKVTLTGFEPSDLSMVNHKLLDMGCKITIAKRKLTLEAPKKLNPVNITTFPYPGFPTDLQACLMAVCTLANGTSRIRETVFNDRFSHTMEMRRLGADIIISSDEATINGVKKLEGTSVMASDIRAGAGIILTCLAAKGKSEVNRIYHVDRGYSKIEDKLQSLGADINRVAT